MRAVNATFNYTKRRRIERDYVQFRATTENDNAIIELTHLSLDHLVLPASAVLVVECRTAQRRIRRFDAGTVGAPRLNYAFSLDEPNAEGVSIVLKVVQETGATRGKILAKCDGLRPRFGGHAESLLAIVPTELGERVWNLNIDLDRGPELQLNSNFTELFQVWGSPIFQALVMPAVVKSIGLWLVQNRDTGDDEPLGHVVAEWKGLFGSWGYSVDLLDPEDLESLQSWADDVAEAFANRYQYFASIKHEFTTGEDV